jgi:hypothetical protein
MADSSPPAGLSDRAAQILKLVGELADAIRASEHSSSDETLQRVASAWKSLFPAIVELGETLPAEPDPVTDWIREVGRVSKWFSDAVGQRGLSDVLFRSNCDGFLRVEEKGRALFKEIAAKRDQFAFVNAPAFTLLDRFPATPAGHVAFMEMVRDEIHYAAEAKRNQFSEKYSNDTVASIVRGRDSLMAEATQRIATLSELPPETVEQVVRILRRDLTPGTVERIDELLTPAVRALRDTWEDRDIPSPAVSSSESEFVEQILCGPDDAELSHRELALLNAYLKQPDSLPQVQREERADETSELAQRKNKLKLICDFNRNLRAANRVPGEFDPATNTGEGKAADPAGEPLTPTKAKRSTERGEGLAKLVAALTMHHNYADGSCLNLEHIGNNELARMADVSISTASAFFKKQFDGHSKYRAICTDVTRLVAALKLLNQEFSPHLLFGAKPPGESEDDKEDEEE